MRDMFMAVQRAPERVLSPLRAAFFSATWECAGCVRFVKCLLTGSCLEGLRERGGVWPAGGVRPTPITRRLVSRPMSRPFRAGGNWLVTFTWGLRSELHPRLSHDGL